MSLAAVFANDIFLCFYVLHICLVHVRVYIMKFLELKRNVPINYKRHRSLKI